MKFAFFLFAITILLQPLGQILERKGMIQIGAIRSISQLFSFKTIIAIITNPYIIAGVSLSVVGLFLWLAVLSNFKVSFIYPFGSISYIVLALLAIWLLGERVDIVNWAGVMLIVGGVFLLNVR